MRERLAAGYRVETGLILRELERKGHGMLILETHDLTRRFGDMVAVNALNIQVEAGQIFGLLGSNGAGKTTVIKMLTTLLPPTAGTATVAASTSANRRRAFGA
jgi:ABC-2 type transport system ATP-binding protein